MAICGRGLNGSVHGNLKDILNVNVHLKLAVELEIYIYAKPVPANKTLLYGI